MKLENKKKYILIACAAVLTVALGTGVGLGMKAAYAQKTLETAAADVSSAFSVSSAVTSVIPEDVTGDTQSDVNITVSSVNPSDVSGPSITENNTSSVGTDNKILVPGQGKDITVQMNGSVSKPSASSSTGNTSSTASKPSTSSTSNTSSTPAKKPAKKSDTSSTPAKNDNNAKAHPGQMYVEGFGWIKDEGGGGEATVVDGDWGEGKQVGIME